MAEEAQGVRNKWLLLVAVLLGVVVVIIYNADRRRAIEAAKGEDVAVLTYTRDLSIGDTVVPRDLTVTMMDAKAVERLGDVMKKKDREGFFAVPRRIRQDVTKSDLAKWSHVTGTKGGYPSHAIKEGMVRISVPISSATSPGRDLRPGDRINLVGIFELTPGHPEAIRAISDVKVLEAGGVGMTEMQASSSGYRTPRASRSYRSIALEVDPAVSLKLTNLTTHVIGEFTVELRNPGMQYPEESGVINEELEELSRTARTGRPQRSS